MWRKLREFWRKKRITPPGRFVGDIQRGGGKFLHLGEKETKLTIRVYPRRLRRDLWKYRYYYGSALALILLVVAVNRFARISAATADFNPTSCLGGWQNPTLAQGKPDAFLDADDPFTEINSAILIGGRASELFCGSFEGEIPENTRPTRLTVKLSWTLKDAVEAPPILATSTLIETTPTSTEATSTVPETNSTSTPTSTAESVPSPAPENPPAVEPAPQQTPTEPASEPTPTPEPTPAPEPAPENPAPAPTADPSVIPAQAGIQGSSFPPPIAVEGKLPRESRERSFLSWIIRSSRIMANAFAQEVTTTDATSTASTSSPQATTTATSTLATANDFLEIVYTLDGVEWKNLARVNHDNWQSLTLEIPVEEVQDWENIGKIQIGFRSLSSTGETPAVYLDAITLSAEYEDLPPPESPADGTATSTATSTDSTNLISASTTTSTVDLFASSSILENIQNLATTTDNQSGASYTRSAQGAIVPRTITVTFSFSNWSKDMDFVDIFGNRQSYWWIEVDSHDKIYPSPCYPSSTVSAAPTFNLPSGDYYSITINSASSLENCEKAYGGQVPFAKSGFGEPGDGGNTKILTVQ